MLIRIVFPERKSAREREGFFHDNSGGQKKHRKIFIQEGKICTQKKYIQENGATKNHILRLS